MLDLRWFVVICGNLLWRSVEIPHRPVVRSFFQDHQAFPVDNAAQTCSISVIEWSKPDYYAAAGAVFLRIPAVICSFQADSLIHKISAVFDLLAQVDISDTEKSK